MSKETNRVPQMTRAEAIRSMITIPAALLLPQRRLDTVAQTQPEIYLPAIGPEQRNVYIEHYARFYDMEPAVVEVVWDTHFDITSQIDPHDVIPTFYFLAPLRAELRALGTIGLKTQVKDNYNPPTLTRPRGSWDVGHWQINDIWNKEISREERRDFKKATRWAVTKLLRDSRTDSTGRRSYKHLPFDDRMYIAYRRYNGSEKYAENTLRIAHEGAEVLRELSNDW